MQKSFFQYTLFFALIYIGVTILFAVISSFISSAGSASSVISPFLSAMIVGQIFVKSEKRAPNDQERKRLTLNSFGVFSAINIALVALAFAAGAFHSVLPAGESNGSLMTILAVVFAVLALVVFFMIRWAYGSLTHKYATKLLGDQNNTFD